MLSREQKSGGGGNWSGSSHARQEEHKRWKERRLVGYKGVEGRKGERKTRYTYVSIRSRERDSHVCVCVCVIEPTQYHGTLSLGTLEVQLCTCFVPSCNYLQVTYLKGRVERERESVCRCCAKGEHVRDTFPSLPPTSFPRGYSFAFNCERDWSQPCVSSLCSPGASARDEDVSRRLRLIPREIARYA